MKAQFYASLLVAALLTTSAYAQETARASFGVTLGPSLFILPDIDTGVVARGQGNFSPRVAGGGLGATLGLSGGINIGKIGAFDAGIGLSGFGTFGKSGSYVVDRFTGPGVVTVGGYTTPRNAVIDLTTNSAPGNSAASASVTHTNPQGGGEVITVNNPVNAGGTVNNYGATIAAGSNSFGLAGVVTQQGAANTAAAYGAVAATDGGLFVGAGDLNGLTVTTDVSRSMVYSGADLTIALASPSGAVSVVGYGGPSYRFINQSAQTTVTVDIPEANPSATVFPLYSMLRDETLRSHYFGGVVGLSVSKPVSDTMIVSLGVEGGAYYVRESYQGRESYSISGGALAAVPLTTVNNANTINLESEGIAWSAKLSPSVTVALAPNRQLTIGGSLDYLSRVATVSRDGSVGMTSSYAGTDDGTLKYNAPAQTVNTLSYGPMWSFAPTVSLTGQF